MFGKKGSDGKERYLKENEKKKDPRDEIEVGDDEMTV